jgi:hypothetical protein
VDQHAQTLDVRPHPALRTGGADRSRLRWHCAKRSRQAFDAESALTLGYARDVLHRTDETGRQALAGIEALVRSGLPPCSAARAN